MTSRRTEDIHNELLNQLLLSAGLECVRSPSTISHYTSSDEFEEITVVEESVSVVSESKPLLSEEERPQTKSQEPVIQAKPPEVFPSPSLRLPLSDHARKIREQSAIHVLPKVFKTDIDPLTIPKIATTPPQVYIDLLGELVGCHMYKSSLAEYWFLDTLANLLRRAQEDDLEKATQAILILWFCEWIKEMQHFDAADRERMMRRFEDNMLAAGKSLATHDRLPTPAEAGVDYRSRDKTSIAPTLPPTPYKHLVQFENAAYECYLQDLAKIIHYIFDLFSTDYQYELVRSIFTFGPDYKVIDAPYQIQQPKSMYVPQKVKSKREKSPKAKEKKKGKKDFPETPEYIALMELKAKEAHYLDELEETEREVWNRKSHILPLTLAVDDTFFDKYWPPPSTEQESEAEPEPIKDNKGKKEKGNKEKGAKGKKNKG